MERDEGKASKNGGGPLRGLRVLDLTSVVMGPFSTQILGDYGAEIITIEPIEGGTNRGMGSGTHVEFSGISLNLLRNKKSVSLDLKDVRAVEAVLQIARTCDIVITNFRPQTLKKLKLDFCEIRKVRRDIIYCQAQGFRSDSARGEDPAYDDIIQAESGLADAACRVRGEPQLAPTIVADKVCGMAIAGAVMAAVVHRYRTGEGQHIEVPMLDVMTAFILVEHGAGAISSATEDAGYSRVLSPERGPQRTADGWINILPYSAAAYDAIFMSGGREDLVGDSRTRGRNMLIHASFLYEAIRKIIATRTTEEWIAFCTENEIPYGRVSSLNDLVAALPARTHPTVGAYRHIPSPIVFSMGELEAAPAPRVGQDTQAVLAEVGIAPERIADLLSRGAARGVLDDPLRDGGL